VDHVSIAVLNLFLMGEDPAQWLAAGVLKRRSAVALVAEPGAPQLSQNKLWFVRPVINSECVKRGFVVM
jgi:hypothetical protein